MIDQKTDRIVVCTRLKMSKLGAARCPELAGSTRIVIDAEPSYHRHHRAVRWRPKTNLPAQRLYISRLGSGIAVPIGALPVLYTDDGA